MPEAVAGLANLVRASVFLDDVHSSRWAGRLARALMVAAACLLGTPKSMADTWDDVVAAHVAGDDSTAFRLALPLAREGEARAQGFVGFLYMHGFGVEKDWDQAEKWLRLASEQGDSSAQANLCVALSSGSPANPDLPKAIYWCRLSAVQGNVGGLFNLGLHYYHGQGAERDMLEAYVWLSLAELDPNWSSQAAKYRAEAKKGLTATEIAEADRRISAWKSAWKPAQP